MSARRLWADRHARRYLSGQALSLLGDSAMWLACGIWVRTLTGSNAAAALTFLFFIAPALLAPAAGLLVDRVRRRPLLIVANVAGAAMLAPLLLVNDRGDVWLIYTVMALYGFLNVLIAPAQSALLAAILPADLLADANATLRTVQEGLRIAAPLAGAGLFTLLGGHAVVLLDMLTFIGATLFLLALPNDQAPNDSSRQTTNRQTSSRQTIKGWTTKGWTTSRNARRCAGASRPGSASSAAPRPCAGSRSPARSPRPAWASATRPSTPSSPTACAAHPRSPASRSSSRASARSPVGCVPPPRSGASVRSAWSSPVSRCSRSRRR